MKSVRWILIAFAVATFLATPVLGLAEEKPAEAPKAEAQAAPAEAPKAEAQAAPAEAPAPAPAEAPKAETPAK
jgi:hypothetical protein